MSDAAIEAPAPTALRETPHIVAELRDEWLDAGGSDLVITREAQTLLEALVGPFTDIADLIDQVAKLSPKRDRTTEVPRD